MNIPTHSPIGRTVLMVFFLSGTISPGHGHAWDQSGPQTALYYMYEAAQEHEQANRHEEAQEIYREIEERAREWELPSWTSYALWVQAAYEHGLRNIERALSRYEGALASFREARDKGEEIDPRYEWMLLSILPDFYIALGLLNKGLHAHRQMEDIARTRIAEETGDEVLALYEEHFDNISNPETLAIAGELALNENHIRLLQGETEGALRNLRSLTERFEKIEERTADLDSGLAGAYSGRITVKELIGDTSDVGEVVEKLEGLPDSEAVNYYKATEQIRFAYIQFIEEDAVIEAALERVESNIRRLEEAGYSGIALSARMYPAFILAHAGRVDEALDLIDKAVEESGDPGSEMVVYLLEARSHILAKHLAEPGHDKEFWDMLETYRRRGHFTEIPFIYDSYATYLYNTEAVPEAVRYARLGLAHSEMFEKIKERKSLEVAVEKWIATLDDAEHEASIVELPLRVTQETSGHTESISMAARRTPFDYIAAYYHLPLSEGELGANIRARSSEPVRLEFFDPHTGRLIGVDANGNGDFNGYGEVAFRDRRGDGFLEFPLEADDNGPVLKLFLYPSAHLEPDGEPSNTEIALTIEVELNGEWRSWATTRFEFVEGRIPEQP